MAYFQRSAADRKAEASRHRQMTEEMAAALRSNIPSIVRAQMKREREIPTVSLSLCKYDKKRKVLTMTSSHIGMPQTFFVESNHTGKVVRFAAVLPCDILFDQDGWDGEQQIYRPIGNVPGVDHMVIHNAW